MKNVKCSLLAGLVSLAAVCVPHFAGAQEINAVDASVRWAFDKASENATTAEVSEPAAVSATSFDLGSNLYFNGTQGCSNETLGSATLSKLNPRVAIGRAEEKDAYVVFSVIPKKGIAFTPKKLKFNACKCGTSGGTLNIYAVTGDKRVEVAKAFDPVRNNDFSAAEYDLSALGATTERVEIYFYIYNLAANKQLAISAIEVIGDFVGTPENVPAYTISAQCGMEGAGSVSVNPSGSSFDEGTVLTVTATENFGYHFSAWVDDEGNTVSVENPYTFEIVANTSLTATYTRKNVYALNLDVVGGANDYLVEFIPEGNVVEGIHYYEEGTDVQLRALNNRILTFTNWEDNTTQLERIITMDGEKNLTANYSCEDYIVAWDFYRKSPTSDRAADYKAESDNAGLLTLRKLDGSTTGWLGAGTDEGAVYLEGNARPWKNRSEKYYFEISFGTKEYTDIKLVTKMGKDYMSYTLFNFEYSIDGKNYTKFGEISIPDKGWYEAEATLPAEAEGKDRIYIRFMPDFDSPVTGNETDLDGVKLGPTFILASANAVPDDVAPQLATSIPAAGAVGVSANGSIILTFDEKIVAVDGAKGMLDGKTITPTVTGKSLIYPYTRLAYETEYTFSLPAGAVTDRSGNAFEGAEITFTTMSRIQPDARLYDAVIAQDGTGDYTTVQAAVDAAPSGSAKPWLIFIKEGVYKEHVNIPADKSNLSFIGEDYKKVFISDDRLSGGDNAVHVDEGATVVARAKDLFFEGISFVNSYGVEENNGPQALALNTKEDRVVFNKCGMYSYQDTWITTSISNARCYAKDCFIEGAVDFIYNSGNYYFDACTLNIVRKSGGYIVAPSHSSDVEWGYVFVNNTITAPGVPSETEVWLGRPWHNSPKTVWINTVAEVTIPAAGWYETMGGLPVIWAEYNTMDGNGDPVDLSQRRTEYYKTVDGEKVWGTAKAVLTAEEAAEYTIQNVLGGNDNWQPELLTEACAAPEPVITGSMISWEAVPYSISYVILKNDKVIDFTTETTYTPEQPADTDVYRVRAVNEYGGLGEISDPVAFSSGLSQQSADEIFEISRIDGGVSVKGITPGSQVDVITVGGVAIYTGKATSSECAVSLSVPGVYIMRVNGVCKSFVY